MNNISDYPVFTPLSWEAFDELYPLLNNLKDGVSEFTFASLFVHRSKYDYKIAKVQPQIYVIIGGIENQKFFMTPCGLPERVILDQLFADYPKWKNIPPSIVENNMDLLKEWGYTIEEDRDNSDYLYLRTDLVSLSGKKFHKKKNLLNSFENTYKYEVKPLNTETVPDALRILELWKETHEDIADYVPAKESLTEFSKLPFTGIVAYVDGKPAGWALGEMLSAGTMYAVHFEKGIEELHGIYQFVNHAIAEYIPETIQYINREQDLGDPGMRQAKLTYRPCGFVKKYVAEKIHA